MAENNEMISNDAGVTVRAYSTKNSNEETDNDGSYSIVYLGGL